MQLIIAFTLLPCCLHYWPPPPLFCGDEQNLNTFFFSPGIVGVFLWPRTLVTVVQHRCHLAVSKGNIVQGVKVEPTRAEVVQGEDEHDARSVKLVRGVIVVIVHSAWIWSSLVVQVELSKHASWDSACRYCCIFIMYNRLLITQTGWEVNFRE